MDQIYGSLGSFYKLEKTDHQVIVANPPYIESELSGLVEKVEQLLRHGKPGNTSIIKKGNNLTEKSGAWVARGNTIT